LIIAWWFQRLVRHEASYPHGPKAIDKG